MNKLAMLMLAAAMHAVAFARIPAASPTPTETTPAEVSRRPASQEPRVATMTSSGNPLLLGSPEYSHNLNLTPSAVVLLFGSAVFLGWHRAPPGAVARGQPDRGGGGRNRGYAARSSRE